MAVQNVLSIQLHVSHGYVGGKSATFPLQTNGWDVDNVNTVNFSNHTGYGFVKGSAITETDLTNVLRGLRDIQVWHDAVITGYIPNDRLILIIADNIKTLKRDNDRLLYLCDPVMGDQGHLYVDESCVQQYQRLLRDKIVDIVTPNQFEVELLCGFKVTDKASLQRAFSYLHDEFGVEYVVITSLTGDLRLVDTDDDVLYCACSTRSHPGINVFQVPVIRSHFTGVGDLFSALLLDKLYTITREGSGAKRPLCRAVNQVLTIMMHVLRLTHRQGLEDYCKYKGIPFREDVDITSKMNDDSMRFFELKVVQSRDHYGYSGPGALTSTVI